MVRDGFMGGEGLCNWLGRKNSEVGPMYNFALNRRKGWFIAVYFYWLWSEDYRTGDCCFIDAPGILMVFALSAIRVTVKFAQFRRRRYGFNGLAQQPILGDEEKNRVVIGKQCSKLELREFIDFRARFPARC